MERTQHTTVQVYDAAGATGNSTVVNVRNFRHILVAVSATLNASLTFKFKGSILAAAQTDLTAVQGVDNVWDYVAFADLQSAGTLVAGDTGVTLNNDSVANNTRQYIINTDMLSQFAVEITAFTDGALDAWVVGIND